jgi:hypothetical protein
MITAEDRKIIEAELDRLDLAYRNAQDRYAYSGSASTDRTMHKYQVLQTALENYLTNNADRSKDRMIARQQDQLRSLKEAVGEIYRKGDMNPNAYTWLTSIIMEV